MSSNPDIAPGRPSTPVPDVAHLVAGATAPIVVADVDQVRFIILNRPHARNALTRAMRADFARVIVEAERDDSVAAMVLTGAGGTFSAGVDLKDRIPGAPPVEPNPGVTLRAAAKPVIAAVDGACVTGALEMALSCDFAIATLGSRFADTHCKVGLFPRWGGGALLTGAIGTRRARQMMLTGQFIDAGTACAWGLVNEIVQPPDLLTRAATLAAAMAERALAQPLSYRRHVQMLRDIDQHRAAAAIEQAALQRYDQERRLAG